MATVAGDEGEVEEQLTLGHGLIACRHAGIFLDPDPGKCVTRVIVPWKCSVETHLDRHLSPERTCSPRVLRKLASMQRFSSFPAKNSHQQQGPFQSC
jgi:hypothetical protein